MFDYLSTKSFVLSHLAILITSLAFLAGLYFILNPNIFKSQGIKNYYPVTKGILSFNLNLSNPEDEIVVFEKSILISGKTSPQAVVLISGTGLDIGLEATPKGDFSRVVELNKGLNEIVITAFDEKGASKSATRTIFYSEEKI